VRALANQDLALAREVAQAPTLLKGYGDTHARGSRSFDAVMAALPCSAQRFRRLREAALADDTGDKLKEELRG
jgi:indolepyruvate ferredoxin oxidoreductase beta subunit